MKIAALDIGGTSIKFGLFDNNIPILQNEVDTKAKLGGEAVMQQAEQLLLALQPFDAIGISTAGQVNSDLGTILYANENIPKYTGMNVKERMQKIFNVPVAVENDVNCAALGEAHFGAGKSFKDFLCLTYGTGIGGAIVQNGNIYTGSSFSAGEFGHIITHAGGLACACGGNGCYEQYASVTALIRNASGVNPEWNNGRILFEHLQNPQVVQLLENWIQEISYGLVSLVHIFNPACILLGGGIMREPFLQERISKTVKENVMPSYRTVEILPTKLNNCAGLYGAQFIVSQYV